MESIVFGTGPIALAETRRKHRRAFAQRLGQMLGIEVVLVVASTYEELAGLVTRGQAQLAWLPPAVFVRVHDGGDATLLLTAVRSEGSRFRGALFVRADAPWYDTVDLAGLRIAWVDRGSCSGYLFPRLELTDRGIDPERFFGAQFFLGTHNAVAHAVEAGKADVGATFIDHTPGRTNGGPGQERPGWALELPAESMRAVMLSPFIPSDAIAATPSLSPALRDQIDGALRSLHERPEGLELLRGLFGADRFDHGAIEDYEPVRRALQGVVNRKG